MTQQVTWTLVRTPTGYQGTINFPGLDGRMMRARGFARDDEPEPEAAALRRGANLALKELKKPARRAAVRMLKAAARSGGRAAVRKSLRRAALIAAAPVPGARALAALSLIGSSPKARKLIARKGKAAFRKTASALLRRRRKRRRGRR